MNENERYELICKEQFHVLDTKIDSILEILRGKNTEAGLIERLRKVEDRQNTMWKGFVIVAGTIITQIVIWFREKFLG